MENYITSGMAKWIIEKMYEDIQYVSEHRRVSGSDPHPLAKQYMTRLERQVYPLMLNDIERNWVQEEMEYEIGYIRMYAITEKVYDVM